jgi:hypothetical protein
MRSPEPIAGQELMEEIGRYLAAVDLFRYLGAEPSWRPEVADPAVALERFLSERREHRVVH